MRMIVDMADDYKILTTVDTGIEQRPGSPHEADMIDLFHSGRYLEVPTPVKGSKWPRSESQRVLTIKPY